MFTCWQAYFIGPIEKPNIVCQSRSFHSVTKLCLLLPSSVFVLALSAFEVSNTAVHCSSSLRIECVEKGEPASACLLDFTNELCTPRGDQYYTWDLLMSMTGHAIYRRCVHRFMLPGCWKPSVFSAMANACSRNGSLLASSPKKRDRHDANSTIVQHEFMSWFTCTKVAGEKPWFVSEIQSL